MILIFNFFPVTAIQIVMLALLNDGAILSIAYDNVRYKDQPEAWNMRLVLGIATVLGVVGPIAAFGLFYLGKQVFHLDHAHLQTLMYLTLSVAGHLTDLPRPHTRPLLVDTPRPCSPAGRVGHAGAGHLHRGLWGLYDSHRVGIRSLRMGLCPGMVPRN